ncbi:MAG: hypothetical protein ACRBB3_00725 [Alphaproteobacteria bacterium]
MSRIKRAQGMFSWVVVLSEISHIFCCVLPSVFSVLTVLVGLGLIGALPVWMESLHHVMHDWEIPLIAMSGFVLVIGWSLHFISKKIDCHDTGCGHEPCGKKKDKTARILQIATLLFVINVSIFLGLH